MAATNMLADLSPESRALLRRENAIMTMAAHGIGRDRAKIILNGLAEKRDIHLASCRYRRQGLCCGTCSNLIERAEVAR